jgi:hypothetical protein
VDSTHPFLRRGDHREALGAISSNDGCRMIIDRRVGRAVDVRDHIIDTLRRELVGPAPGCPLVQLNGEEILRPQDPPRYRYSCGILFPRGVTYSGSLDAREEVSEIEAAEPVTGEDSGEIESNDGQDDPPGEGPAGETETEVDPSSMFLPSTMGVSFLADVSGGLCIRQTGVPTGRRRSPDTRNTDATGRFRSCGSGSLELP